MSHQPIIKVYKGFSSEKVTYIFGHLLQSISPLRDRPTTNPFKNALEMYRRYTVSGAKNEKIILSVNGEQHFVTTDKKGYFQFKLEGALQSDQLSVYADQYPDACEDIQLKLRNPKRIIISDVDDTILVSHATSLWKKLYLLLTKNHQTRSAFVGIRDMYSDILGAHDQNMCFYVSSSEWNLYDFLRDFITFNDLPDGVLLLQDLKSGITDLFRSGGGSHEHKLVKIRSVIEAYPDAQLVLIGDSGQKDPEIYRSLAFEFSDNIEKIYIRDVRRSKRKRVLKIADELREVNVSLEIIGD